MKGKSKIIEEYNVLLQNLASRYQLAFINSYPIFLEEGSNQLKAHLTGDGLHINDEGYQLWSQFLKPYLID